MDALEVPRTVGTRRRGIVWLIALAMTLPAVALLAYGFTRNPRALPSPLVGRPAPVFRIPAFNGGVVDTAALQGEVLIVNFWASWCYPACYEEAPRLQRIWDEYRDRGVVVIGVNIQDREDSAREFIRRFGQTFPNGIDQSGRVSIDFGVYGVPETFVIDREGRIVAKYNGAVAEQWLREQIRPLLNQAAPRP